MSKEIVIWENEMWIDIQDQDNPTFDYIDGGTRRNEAILVMRVLPHVTDVGEGGYVVIEVPLTGDVIRRGLFWKFEYATMFAEALTK